MRGQKRAPGDDGADEDGGADEVIVRRPEPGAVPAATAEPAATVILAPEVRSRLRQLREELVGLRAALKEAAD